MYKAKTQQMIGEACTRELLTAFPDETIGAALRRTDLVRAYDIALTRCTERRHSTQQVRLGSFTGA